MALLCALTVGAMVLTAEVLGRLLAIPGRVTRLAVHIGCGTLVALTPLLFRERWWPAGIALTALLALFLSRREGWLPSLHAARPTSYGTVWFSFSALVLYLIAWEKPHLITLPLLVMAFADGAGMLVGEMRRNTILLPEYFRGKSWDGSIAVFAITGLCIGLGWEAFGFGSTGEALLVGLACAPVAAAVEAISFRGLDNLTLPFAMAFTLLLIEYSIGQPQELLLAEAAAVALTAGAVRWRALRADGAAGAFLIATWLLGGGGWSWTLPVIVFFILSSLLSLLSENLRRGKVSAAVKGAKRDLVQVLANGGIPVGLFMAHILGLPLYLAWPAFLGAVATATADTWATEIGTALKTEARLITTGQIVPAGTSGGITLMGSISSILGAVAIGITALVVAPTGVISVLPAALAGALGGLSGSLADSILGATLQVRFRCPACGKITEGRFHCEGVQLEKISGLRVLDNDAVNACTGILGAAVALLLFAAFPG